MDIHMNNTLRRDSMERKAYIAPEIEVITFSTEDVIMDSIVGPEDPISQSN